MSLAFTERPADGEPAGLLVLHHGRGSDEHDMIGLADALDPQRRLHVVAPGGPLIVPGWPGQHWYIVPRVGYPDPDTFRSAHRQLAAFHDELWQRTGIGPEATVLGGFSMGSVMSYALGLDATRPAPAGILAFSGFIPTVESWEADLSSRPQLPVFISHGRRDTVMEVAFARSARERLERGSAAVSYHESDAGHEITPAQARAAQQWLDGVSRVTGPAPTARRAPTPPAR
jgi:phospholipase/carboxylesterase